MSLENSCKSRHGRSWTPDGDGHQSQVFICQDDTASLDALSRNMSLQYSHENIRPSAARVTVSQRLRHSAWL